MRLMYWSRSRFHDATLSRMPILSSDTRRSDPALSCKQKMFKAVSQPQNLQSDKSPRRMIETASQGADARPVEPANAKRTSSHIHIYTVTSPAPSTSCAIP
jgi:hypothetical protein